MPAEQLEAIRCFWANKDLRESINTVLTEELAKSLNFRAKYVRERPPEWKAEQLMRRMEMPCNDAFLQQFVLSFLHSARGEMMVLLLSYKAPPKTMAPSTKTPVFPDCEGYFGDIGSRQSLSCARPTALLGPAGSGGISRRESWLGGHCQLEGVSGFSWGFGFPKPCRGGAVPCDSGACTRRDS